MKISIAMATYNGAKYLQEQLDSFILQSRLPDELVVCDDGSSDETVDILKEFASIASFTVRVICNKNNLGYTKNFEKALSLCSGDLIFLSDQDDVWFKNKLEVVEQVFVAEFALMVVINDQEITDEYLRLTGNTIFSNTKALGYGNSWLSAGCCTAIRSDFRDLLLPFPSELGSHDGWIHKVAIFLNVRKVIPDVLQLYRRHSVNSSESMASILNKSNILMPMMKYGLKDVTEGWLKEAVLSECLIGVMKNKVELLRKLSLANKANTLIDMEHQRINFIYLRIKLLKKKRLKRIIGIIRFYRSGGYTFFSGFKSAIKDCIR